MGKKHRYRPQKPKGMGNRAMYDAMQEIRRSSASSPHRNLARYDMNDFRAQSQSGKWE